MARLIDVSMPEIPSFRVCVEFRDVKLCVQLVFEISDYRLDRLAWSAPDITCLLVFRPSHMGHEDRPSTAFHYIVQSPESAVDPVRVFDFTVLDDIVVESYKDCLALRSAFWMRGSRGSNL